MTTETKTDSSELTEKQERLLIELGKDVIVTITAWSQKNGVNLFDPNLRPWLQETLTLVVETMPVRAPGATTVKTPDPESAKN